MTGVFALVFFLLCCAEKLEGEGLERAFPVIARLDPRDLIFRQYLDDVEAGRRAVFSRYPAKTAEEITKELVIYTYTPSTDDDLMLIAARCNIPYDTFATLNRWPSLSAFSRSLPIMMPSIPGIFIAQNPASDLERLIFSSRNNAGILITIKMPSGNFEQFYFIPGDSFTPNERHFFLNPGLFRFPLHSYRLTSSFGMRVSPISGKRTMHGGLDLAAPAGTPVFSAGEGIITETGRNAVYGKYVVITHNGGWTSLYGHLSSIDAALHSKVKSGTIIGKVGNTGLSTGPHLHFELRQNGKLQDPGRLLKRRDGA
ncbi:MAG: M23 family metallopeptidase [Spirochaetaceae bacterium]|nr:M23 family metallopeptidase [Spirochaetaceae bacterium]